MEQAQAPTRGDGTTTATTGRRGSRRRAGLPRWRSRGCTRRAGFDYQGQGSDGEGVATPADEDHQPLLPQVRDEDLDKPEVELPKVQPIQRPTLAEYETKWAEKIAQHSRATDQAFGANNLCPKPVPQLWQDAPHVAFHELKSPAAQGRLALCRPISGLQESTVVDGLEKYAHITGDVFFCRRAAWQVASTMGFVLNKNTGAQRSTICSSGVISVVLSIRAGVACGGRPARHRACDMPCRVFLDARASASVLLLVVATLG